MQLPPVRARDSQPLNRTRGPWITNPRAAASADANPPPPSSHGSAPHTARATTPPHSPVRPAPRRYPALTHPARPASLVPACTHPRPPPLQMHSSLEYPKSRTATLSAARVMATMDVAPRHRGRAPGGAYPRALDAAYPRLLTSNTLHPPVP
ncbi:hypothetical protein DFH09DRAFT_1326161 [Mycena vulgaris]|nr:hypothetical protein DFH09DRAFT_1326161 [Mycena vulgaris]